MILISLQSGSNGNCLYVESAGQKLLFDAGISGKQAQERLALFGRDIRDVDALIISHEHTDHVRCAGIFQRKFGIPLFITEPTLRAAGHSGCLGKLSDVHHFRSGDAISIGGSKIETLPTPHDGVDSVCFVIDDGSGRLGIFTDLGHVNSDIEQAFASVDAALLESNYDPEMLDTGRYPLFLKRRIRGEGGHISNPESAELAARCCANMKWICLGHLSAENNTPEKAIDTHRNIAGSSIEYHVAGRYGPGSVLEI